jgi:hypothetical protein
MKILPLFAVLSACGTTAVQPPQLEHPDAGIAGCDAGALGTWALTFTWKPITEPGPSGPPTDTLTVFETADGGLDADFASVVPLSGCYGTNSGPPVYVVAFDSTTCALDVSDDVHACFNGEEQYNNLHIKVQVAGDRLDGSASYLSGSWAPHGQNGTVTGQR